ncbi:hypothetical protein J6590_107267, partial [Homalodisca vitripennis]
LNAANRISKGLSNQKWRVVLATHCEVHYALPFLTGSSYSDAKSPDNYKEKPSLLKDVGRAMGQELVEAQVSAVHRVPTYKTDRAIVVQFTGRMQRDAWTTHSFQKVENPDDVGD